MLSFRGDAHKLYLKLKHAKDKKAPLSTLKEINEIQQLQAFYQEMSNEELNHIKYRMIKEKNGTGIIPILLTTVPWLLFIFSKKIQSLLVDNEKGWWIIFMVVYLIVMVTSIIIHFREKAWSSTHLSIIEDVLQERKEQRENK